MKLSIFIRSIVLVCVVTVQQGVCAVPKLTIKASPTSDVRLVAFDENTFPAFKSAFPDMRAVGTKPAALVLINLSNRKLFAISVVWTYVDERGRQSSHSLKSSSFFSVPQRAVALGQSKLLITPSFMLPESLSGAPYLGGSVNAQQQAERIARSADILAEVDLIIFEDGEIVGPDQLHYVSDIEGFRAAESSLVEQIRGVSGQDAVTALLAQLASSQPLIDDYVGMWKTRIAKRLLRSRNMLAEVDGLERTLQHMPPLPTFRRR